MTTSRLTRAGMHINDWVKVRLTPAGVEILRQQHEMLNHRIMIRTAGTGTISPFNLRTDEDGYTSFQIWDLMARFGTEANEEQLLHSQAIVRPVSSSAA